jgi:hypothetical protein
MRQEAAESFRSIREAKEHCKRRQAALSKPVKGALRVWWIPQVPSKGDPFFVEVASLIQAKLVLRVLGDYDFYQLANRIKGDFCNTGGLEEFDGASWSDWEDPETGGDIDDYEIDSSGLSV